MRPLDRRTRARTVQGRLRALDALLVRTEGPLLSRSDGAWARAAFVDVGFGEHPATTLESAAAFRSLNPALHVVGVDLDAGRVLAARAHANALTEFREGGFALPLRPEEQARLVRVMNVLRAYPAEAVPQAHAVLGAHVLPGGLVVEGSTDTPGRVLVAHLLRRAEAGLVREGLVFHTDFRRGFAPRLFRDWLPRDLRRRVKPGEPIFDFLAAWEDAWAPVRGEPRAAFRASVEGLAGRVQGVSVDGWMLDAGYLLWRPPGGVPR